MHKDRKQAREREGERERHVRVCMRMRICDSYNMLQSHTQNYTIDVCVGTFFAHTQAQYIYIA